MKNGTLTPGKNFIRITIGRLFFLLLFCSSMMVAPVTNAQCPGGYSQATLNWDALDYFVYSGNYTSGNGYLPNATFATTQNFAFGSANRLTIVADNNITLDGDNATHTGDAGSYGNGFDVQYTTTTNNTTITLTFENEVSNLRFSIYDVDNNQRFNVSAQNAASVAQTVTMSLANGTSSITFSGNPGTNPQALAPGFGYATTDNQSAVNVDIAGPVRTITLTTSNATGDFWLSDITACTAGSFPLNYYQVARPFTGQPGYVLHAFDKAVYALDPATGVTKYLFTDPAILGAPSGSNRCYINSMGYDPYNRVLYYVFSLSDAPGSNRQIRKYDFNTETISVVLNDVNTIGIPTSTVRGVESGAGAFYNGSLYLGIETVNSGRNSNRENVVYRVDLDGSGIPYRASQVYATPCDNGSGTLINDWADFLIHDGELVNFDGAGVTTQTNVYHYDMMTGALVDYPLPAFTPGQPTVDWAGNYYQVHGRGMAELPHVALYNGNGTIGPATFLTSTPMFSPASPSLGDAAEAFRPKSDFGDAPASFDPDPLAPATHEIIADLRLGANIVREWNSTPSTLADAEGAEEDGIGAAPTLNYDATLTYNVNNIQVFNNTGGQARVVAWLDYNFDGVFQAIEGRTVLVNSSGVTQSINLSWSNIWVPLTSNLRTYLRIRVTRAANGMTTSSMNGWFGDGEVEDFEVLLGAALPKDIQSFNVKKQTNATVEVKWSINVQQQVESYEILRSSDNNNWTSIGTVSARDGFGLQNYTFNDLTPVEGTSYYRIRINYQATGANKLSEVRSVKFDVNNGFIRILPNPAQETAELQISSTRKGEAVIRVYDRSGRMVMNLKQGVDAGMNSIRINNLSKLSDGVYTIRTIVNGRTTSNQLIIKKQ